MTGSWSRTDADGSRVEVIDHGDGTATRTETGPRGEFIAETTIDVPVPAEPDPTTVLLDQLAAIDPALWPTLVDADPARVRGAVGVATALIA